MPPGLAGQPGIRGPLMGLQGRARETTQKANPPTPALPATEPCSQISTSPKQSVCDILANIIFKNVETDKCRENLNSASVVLPKYSDNKITITSTGEMKTMHMSEVVGLGGRGPTFALGRPRADLRPGAAAGPSGGHSGASLGSVPLTSCRWHKRARSRSALPAFARL